MINHIEGTVSAVGATWVVIDVGGFGVRCLCTASAAAAVRVGQRTTMATSLVVREDSLTLYGFSSDAERDVFELVQQASGIGPKIAQSVVSVLAPEEFRAAVAQGNVAILTKVPGIGSKGAQKMVIELKDKINTLGAIPDYSTAPSSVSGGAWREQVVAGLEGLGWSGKDAEAACDRVSSLVEEQPDIGVAALMKAALRSLAR